MKYLFIVVSAVFLISCQNMPLQGEPSYNNRSAAKHIENELPQVRVPNSDDKKNEEDSVSCRH